MEGPGGGSGMVGVVTNWGGRQGDESREVGNVTRFTEENRVTSQGRLAGWGGGGVSGERAG